MKNALLSLALVFTSLVSYAQGWEWMRGACDTGSENGESRGMHVAVDIYGGVYHAGIIWKTGHIGPFQFSADGGTSDISLVKYDSSGNAIWAIFGGPKVFTQGLVSDPFGNIYVSGVYHDTALTFGGEILYNPLTPDSLSSFIAKVDSGGNIIWLKNVGDIRNGGYTTSYGNGLASDNCGNLYFFTVFTKNFSILGNNFVIDGKNDLFVAKFDSSGSFIWGNTFGGEDLELTAGISLTNNDDIIIAGSSASDTLIIGDTLAIGDVIPQTMYRFGGFVAMLDNSGNPIWAKCAVGSASGYFTGIVTDGLGNSFVSGGYGAYDTIASMSVSTSQIPDINPFTENGFVAKFDNTGNVDWVKSVVSKRVHAKSIAIDKCNNVWIVGVNFDSPNSIIYDTVDGNIISIPTENNGSTFISAWSANGTYISSIPLPTGSYSNVDGGLTCDKYGNLYFSGLAQIDTFILASDSLYNANGHVAFGGYPHNMFVAKYNTGFNCPAQPEAPCWPASINSAALNTQSFTIYPNPTHDIFTIETTLSGYTITILNTLGQVVERRTGSERAVVDVSRYTPGVYYLRVKTPEGESFNRKIVVE